jgi:predicted transcriptional regulator
MAGKDNGIALLQALGNRVAGLPFTLVLDRQGNVVATRRGVMTHARLQQILDPLL